MVVIPAGEFVMGSSASEAERHDDEGPRHRVSIADPFALGRTEVTVAQFRQFAEEAGYRTDAERNVGAEGCFAVNCDTTDLFVQGEWLPGCNRNEPGFSHTDSTPVVCVSWNDAQAYARWMSAKTGRPYRLPTEAEWEYAARAGTTTDRYWGDAPDQACRFANVADQSRYKERTFERRHECNDGHFFAAPVGSYAPNRFGLYDMIGNVWEWTEDCANPGYEGAPGDGSAWIAGNCGMRVSRGGSSFSPPTFARSANRNLGSSQFRSFNFGFRLARTLER